jgi:hypothetical protein
MVVVPVTYPDGIANRELILPDNLTISCQLFRDFVKSYNIFLNTIDYLLTPDRKINFLEVH